MRIYQSLAEASLYRALALIPEQAVFGLALASDATLKSSPETRRNLELGREFCNVFESLSAGVAYRPTNSSTAAIALGIQELPSEVIGEWREAIGKVRQVIDDILDSGKNEPSRIKEAARILQEFANFAKQSLSDSDNMQII